MVATSPYELGVEIADETLQRAVEALDRCKIGYVNDMSMPRDPLGDQSKGTPVWA